jgi:hypothetical protein
MVGCDYVDDPIYQSLDYGIAIVGRAQRRADIGLVALHVGVSEREVVGSYFSCDRQAIRLCSPYEVERPPRADVLEVKALTRRVPEREQCLFDAFVLGSGILPPRLLLTVNQDRQAGFSRSLEAPAQKISIDRMSPIVGQRDRTRGFQAGGVGQFPAGKVFSQCADNSDPNRKGFAASHQIRHQGWTVSDRVRVRHRCHLGEAARRGAARARLERLAFEKSRIA